MRATFTVIKGASARQIRLVPIAAVTGHGVTTMGLGSPRARPWPQGLPLDLHGIAAQPDQIAKNFSI